MTGILYAVAEIAVFMVGALLVGILLGRVTKRGGSKSGRGADSRELATTRETVRELEIERAELRDQLRDAKERTRLLAAEVTAEEKSEDFAEERKKFKEALAEAESRADRLRATIAERDKRIASLTSGEPPSAPTEPPSSVGYSHSAGSFADTRIVFDEDEYTG